MALPPRGDFSFIEDPLDRQFLADAFHAVESVPGGWAALMPEPPAGEGFMFSVGAAGSARSQIDDIINHSPIGSGHSGYSYAMTMRQMQGIARLGWNGWVQTYINRQMDPVEAPVAPAAAAAAAAAAPVGAPAPVAPAPVGAPVNTPFDGQPGVCPICYESYDETTRAVNNGSNTNPVRCGHMFHEICITQWRNSGRNTCPVCRGNIATIHSVNVVPPPPTESAATIGGARRRRKTYRRKSTRRNKRRASRRH